MSLAPGIYDMPAATYHQDPCDAPSLSSSIIKLICLSSPAHARHAHPRLNPAAVAEEAEHFDIGTAAHALLLEGNAAAVDIIDAKDWRTITAREARDAARKAGRVPILAKHWDDVQAMVHSAHVQLKHHKDGGAGMFTLGKAEQTLIWREGSVWCRARLDWLRLPAGRLAFEDYSIDDFKSTSASANPDTWTRTMFQNGFDIQAAWYIRGVKALTGVHHVEFRFAVQETYPPYALSVIALGPDAMILAEKKILYALEVWAEGLAKNDWVGYPRKTCYATLPPWHEAWWLERELTGVGR